MPRAEFSRKVRAQIIARANGKCEACSGVLKPGEAAMNPREQSALAIGRMCCAPDCDRGGATKLPTGWVCNLHYQRLTIHGSFDLPEKVRSRDVICAHCNVSFDRGYAINSRRAENPQFCSRVCRAHFAKRKSLEKAEDRFWSFVDKRGPNECWEWKGSRSPRGYGRFTWRRDRTQLASRIAYHFSKGDPASSFVCHSCDNPPCCNPNHLWLGSHDDNMRDASSKGRIKSGHTRGETHGTSKLTEQQARLVKYGEDPIPELAKKLGVTSQAIRLIRAGRNWAWL